MGRDYFRNFTVDDFLQIPLFKRATSFPVALFLPSLEWKEEKKKDPGNEVDNVQITAVRRL